MPSAFGFALQTFVARFQSILRNRNLKKIKKQRAKIEVRRLALKEQKQKEEQKQEQKQEQDKGDASHASHAAVARPELHPLVVVSGWEERKVQSLETQWREQTLLWLAAMRCDLRSAAALLDRGTDVDASQVSSYKKS